MTAVKRTRANAKPNVRQRKFIKNLTSGMGVGQSALRAGYSDKSEGSALLKNPVVLTALQTAMDRAGIGDDYLSSKIKEGLEATYPEKKAKDGSVLQAAAPDFFTRGQYLDKALKVRGDYAPERRIEQKQILTINVNMDTLRGLKDCGVLDAEILDDRTDGTKALTEGRQEEDREDSGEPTAVRAVGDQVGQGDAACSCDCAPQESRRREGPGEAEVAPEGSPRPDVSIGD